MLAKLRTPKRFVIYDRISPSLPEALGYQEFGWLDLYPAALSITLMAIK